VQPQPGIQIRVIDAALQAYLQRYPFASGPNEAMNQRARTTVSKDIFFREVGPEVETVLLPQDQTHLSDAELARLLTLFSVIAMPPADHTIHINDFGWEANLIPRHAKNVLVIGCGNGVELAFLRAVLPEARITALDYHNYLIPGLAEAVDLAFLQGDMHDHLRSLSSEFDLIFSNHTLEHLYDPDHTLGILSALLTSGGHLVSILPMVGQSGTPFLGKINKFIATRATSKADIPLLDLIYFDPGHPWKTNPSDIVATLTRAGLNDIEIFQRRDHLCRPTSATSEQLHPKRKRAVSLNNAFLASSHSIAKLLFPRDVPLRLRSLIFAVERRLPFGTNRAMNALCEECLFICRKP
jgi:SAM-dependent methyltransferase